MRVCHNRRIYNHKVLEGLAKNKKGKCSIGWSYGFKSHLVTSDIGEITDFLLTPGNVDDRTPLRQELYQNAMEKALR